MIPERKYGLRWDERRLEATTLSGEGNPSHIRVLMYHRIVPDKSTAALHWSFVSVDNLREQLDWLDTFGYTPITFDDYRLFTLGRLDLPKKPVIITFDDGYEDTYSIAAPVLKDFGMKAVIFILGERSIRVNTWDLNIDIPRAPLMTDEQILELQASGHEIGSHSLTHPMLSSLDERQAWNEISRSRILLEILLNAPVRTFCYPFGFVTPSLKRLVREAGYTMACSVGTGPVTFGSDLFEVRRIPITNTTGRLTFGFHMTAPYQWFSWARSKAKGILTGSSPLIGGERHSKNGPREQVPLAGQATKDRYHVEP